MDPFHLARIRIGQCGIGLPLVLQLAQNLPIPSLAFLEQSHLLLQHLALWRLSYALRLVVLPIQIAQIALDTRFDLLEQFHQLFLGVITPSVIHRFEFGPVYGY